jgi:hypothetical protein|tara:strand:- start:311 stop:928 length:618 start_codon:yes stop_codon:yes gene_type:complete
MKFKDTIGIYNNAFSKEECGVLIEQFEKANLEGTTYTGKSGDGVDEYKKSNDFNLLSSNNTINKSLSDLVMEKFNHYLSNHYLENYPHSDEFNHHRIVNGKTYYPLLQMQKYDQNSGHYNTWHTEKEDLRTSDRMFVFILYLNDVVKGGETGFLFKEEGDDNFFRVKPQTGKLIIHPSSWPYIHKGYMPESDDKYILTTWLLYNE